MASNQINPEPPMKRHHGSVSFCTGSHPLHTGFLGLYGNEPSLSDSEIVMKRKSVERAEQQRLLADADGDSERQLDFSGINTFNPTRRSLVRSCNVDDHDDDQFNELGVDLHSKSNLPKRPRHRRRRASITGGMFLRHKHKNLVGFEIPPPNVHNSDWRDMLTLVDYTAWKETSQLPRKTSDSALDQTDVSFQPLHQPPLFNEMRFSSSNLSLNKSTWIADTFFRRECTRFVPTKNDPERCGCGRNKNVHLSIVELTGELLSQSAEMIERKRRDTDDRSDLSEGLKMTAPLRRTKSHKMNAYERWSIKRDTRLIPTNAFGQIEFQGGPHPYKAQYLRLSFDTEPATIMSLFDSVWQIPPPKLIITVHGGTNDFDLQPKLARVFRKGLFKAAQTTGAWILTCGLDVGVVKQVSAAWEAGGASPRSKVVCIGIAPWGLLKKRDELIGEDKVVNYYPYASKTRFMSLNNRHSYFLLVDNGTVGRYGAEVILRKRLETYINQKQKVGETSVPVVCVVVEGGTCTIRSVLEYVTTIPRVPVVICDGTGRASDLLAFVHSVIRPDNTIPEGVMDQLTALMKKVFPGCRPEDRDRILRELSLCGENKQAMTIFRLGEKGTQDVDHAILTALLSGSNTTPPEQLSLALAWNRVDIARYDIFPKPYDWPQSVLHNVMMEALIHNRVDFVKLLLENGVNMQKFLTYARLEELYNTDQGPANTLYYIVKDVTKIRAGYRYNLQHIGLAIEKLMGNSYKATYTSKSFRRKYNAYTKRIQQQHKQAARSATSAASRSRGGSAVLSHQSTEPILLGNFTASMPDTHTLSENMVAPQTGNRALGNHILWRSAYRRDNVLKPPRIAQSQDLEEESEMAEISSDTSAISDEFNDFRYPYSELLVWAVLTKRQELALCMWEHGEEALAKALVACKLYKSLATEAAEDYLEVEICDELKKYAEEFRILSLELLEHCYKLDDAQTLQLLTYELSQWGSQTCLSLAVVVNNKEFLAHPCCQILLADLWHGGLRIRSNSNFKIIAGIFCPLYILALEFKSREELLNQPQRAVEHEQDLAESSTSDSSDASSESSSSSDDDDERNETDKEIPNNRRSRKNSHGSNTSLHLGGLFKSGRKKRKERLETRDTDASCNEAKLENGEAGYGTFGLGQSTASAPPLTFVPRKKQTTWSEGLRSFSSTKSMPNQVLSDDGKSQVSMTKESAVSIEVKKDKKKKIHKLGATILPRPRQIKLRRKFYEFYAAPITAFWTWSLSFVAFMCLFTYVLLVKTEPEVSAPEWIVFAFVVAFGLEYLKKIFMMAVVERNNQDPITFFTSFWNVITGTAILTYFIGFLLRVSFGPMARAWGRVILACDSVLWTMKILDYMSVHPRLGPYITMAGKMIVNMVYIVVMLCVSLLGFGLARQSITYPNEDWHWILLRNIFYKPYFMLYGEVYADEIAVCSDEAWDAHFEDGTPLSLSANGTIRQSCVPGHFIPPILMTIFLLIANILLMSMLIAIFNHIFDSTNEMAQQIWLFQRYRQVMEYEGTPSIPPPFTPIRYVFMFFEWVKWKCETWDIDWNENPQVRHIFDYSLKLFLDPGQVEKLHDFEEDCMEDLYRERERKKHQSNEERIFKTSERTETILSRVHDLQSHQKGQAETLSEYDARLQAIEKSQEEMLDLLRMLVGRSYSHGVSQPPDIQLSIDIDHSMGEMTDEEKKLPAIPVRTRLNTLPSSGAPGPAEAKSTDEAGLTSPSSFRSRHKSFTSLEMSKMRQASTRKRHGAYTSITDGINIEEVGFRLSLNFDDTNENSGNSAADDDDDETFRKKMSAERKISVLDSKRLDEDELADCEMTEIGSEIEERSDEGQESRRDISEIDKGAVFVVEEDEEEARAPQTTANNSRSVTP